jgi:small-conductance mechanosensitive channel
MLKEYYTQIISTVIVVVIYLITKKITAKIIRSFAYKASLNDSRKTIITRYFNILQLVLLFTIIFTIWGVKADNFFVTLTSVFTVIGVAMFAQWSLLSNITAGILLFFSFPFRIGDIIRIQDKDFPTEAKILDINAFHVLLETKEGEKISYPNNLLLQKGIVILSQDIFNDNNDVMI